MKRTAIMALEGLDETTDEVAVPEVDMGPIEEASTEIDQTADAIEEGEVVSDAMGATAELLEKSGDEEASPEVVEMASIAIEHFCNQVKYRRNKIKPAMESFGKTKGSTKQMAAELRLAQEEIQKNIQIAQEGIIDTISKSFEMFFVTNEVVLSKLKVASNRYDKGTLKDSNIENPLWGKYIPSSSSSFDGKDAVKIVSSINSVSKNGELKQTVEKMGEYIVRLTREVRGNWFVSNKSDIEQIENIHRDILETEKKMDSFDSLATTKNSKSFAPISPADKKKLVQEITEFLNDKELEKAVKKFTGKKGAFEVWTIWQSTFRLKSIAGNTIGGAVGGGIGGKVAGYVGTSIGTSIGGNVGSLGAHYLLVEDVNKARKAATQARETISGIIAIIKQKVKIANALVSYIEDSVK